MICAAGAFTKPRSASLKISPLEFRAFVIEKGVVP